MKPYDKKPLTFEQQVAQLKSRGLTIHDENKALSVLQEISYYRLSAYFLPFQSQKDKFNQGTTFSQIIHTYSFDRELRLLVFDCIERIEVAIRTQIIYVMAHKHNNSHWQDDKKLFSKKYNSFIGDYDDPYAEFQEIIKNAVAAKKPEVFIKHYKQKYNKPKNPPSWMVLALLTLGGLSNLYKGLKHNDDKLEIAKFFDIHHTVLASWLHSLTYVRNICAHHSRLWNRDLAIEPTPLQKPVGDWISKRYENPKRMFYFLCLLKYLLNRANPNNSMKEKLVRLFDRYPDVPIKYIGIPSDGKGSLLDWQNEKIWN